MFDLAIGQRAGTSYIAHIEYPVETMRMLFSAGEKQSRCRLSRQARSRLQAFALQHSIGEEVFRYAHLAYPTPQGRRRVPDDRDV